MKIQLPENLKAGDVIEFGNFPPGIPESAKLVWSIKEIRKERGRKVSMELDLFVETVHWKSFSAFNFDGDGWSLYHA